MGITQRFMRRFSRRGQRDHAVEEVAQAASDDGVRDRDATDRFRRKGTVDYDAVFSDAAIASARKHRTTGTFCDPLLAQLVCGQWRAFFDCFRQDETAFELAHFRREALEVQERLDEMGTDAAPDLVLARQMLYLLTRFTRERFESLDQRLEQLMVEQRKQEAELHAIQLSTSWQSDELAYARDLIIAALRQRDSLIPSHADGAPAPVSELLCAILGIQKAPPRPRAHIGHRARQRRDSEAATTPVVPTPDAADGESALERRSGPDDELSLVRSALRGCLDGRVSPSRMRRILEDDELAARLMALADENLRYRRILERVGLLPTRQGETTLEKPVS